ncbi:hypothetical protein BH11BAC2_BH11BAC2_21160 [soil metagenome]
MMKNLITVLLIIMFSSCNETATNDEQQITDSIVTIDTISVKVGADTDVHGCKSSAGFQWSILKNDCIQIFETAVKLQSQHSDSVSAAFILFNEDKSKAELFVSGESTSLILIKQGEEGAHYWQNGPWKLFPWKGYVLKKGDKVLYVVDL